MVLSLPFMLVLVAVGVAVIAKLVIQWFEKQEMDIHQQQLEAVKAVHLLQSKMKPGRYTFRWAEGRMLEPEFEQQEGFRVSIRFVDGDQVFEKIQEMPIAFQLQLLELIRSGMTQKVKKAGRSMVSGGVQKIDT